MKVSHCIFTIDGLEQSNYFHSDDFQIEDNKIKYIGNEPKYFTLYGGLSFRHTSWTNYEFAIELDGDLINEFKSKGSVIFDIFTIVKMKPNQCLYFERYYNEMNYSQIHVIEC